MQSLKKWQLFTFFSVICASVLAKEEISQAITIVPVADLTLERLSVLYPHKKPHIAFKALSLEGNKRLSRSCPRTHQLLFNEQVEVLQQEGDEVLVRVPNCFYLVGKTKKREYWTHKSNICPIKKLQKKGICLKTVPKPIQFYFPFKKKIIVTLALPYHDKKNKRTFSAGTRFVPTKKQKNIRCFSVWALDPTGKKVEQLNIPKSRCISAKPYTNEEKRKTFIKLLKKWSEKSDNGTIPYVWGGCSFAQQYKPKDIYPEKGKGSDIRSFKQKTKGIASGFDCSGALLRAAQAADIPYFFKNSSTILKSLKKVERYEDLEDGDLLYTPGHIMMISNLKENKLIEARSHWSGFGKLLETKLQDGFENVKDYKKLFADSSTGKRFTRVDSEGNASGKARSYRFLKLPA